MSESDDRLRKIFCDIIGVDPADYQDYTISALIREWLKISEITKNEILGPEKVSRIVNRLNGSVKMDEDFIALVANVISTKLATGLEEGWIDPQTRKPLPLENILQIKLGKYVTFEGEGSNAVNYCLEQIRTTAGLPGRALSLMMGRGPAWLSPSNQYNFSPFDIARMADIVVPYFSGKKKWTGVLEVDDPDFIHNHRVARNYLIRNLKAHLMNEEDKQEVDALRALPDSLGPTLKRLRKVVGLNTEVFGAKLLAADLTSMEANYYASHFVEIGEDGKEHLVSGLAKKLDCFAQVIAEHWPMRGQLPSTQLEGTVVMQHNEGKTRE